MRKRIVAIAARVSAAKLLLDAADVHIRDASVEDDQQRSTALLTMGSIHAAYAEMILRAVNNKSAMACKDSDAPDSQAEGRGFDQEVVEQTQQTATLLEWPGSGRWFHWHDQGNERWTALSGNYSGLLVPRNIGSPTAGWLLDIRCSSANPSA